VTRLALVAVVALVPLLAAPGACQPIPEPVPVPVATGGAPATGGASGVGGWLDPFTGGAPATGGALPGTGGAPQPRDDCEAAEWRLAELRCRRDDGSPRWLTPAGTPLATVCRAREADGDSICPACLARVASCAGIGACRPRQTGRCPL
jgi:hypothetical protein